MGRDGLFDELPEMAQPSKETEEGAARLREPDRARVELVVMDPDRLIAPDHPARVIWAYVETLDLSPLEEEVRAREHTPGQAPASPRLLLALWLLATSEGVGSARALARLCETHDAYRWLCGGVSVNYHGLAEFRTAHADLLDRLLAEHVAALSAAGVIELDEVVQDGVRVRASAGAGSFRRKKKLYKELKKARRLVARLKQEAEDDPGASERRIRAARERAARERQARLAAALAKHAEIEAERLRRAKTNKKQVAEQTEPRVSTTDPEARVMKMADGGFRPAYNAQVATVAGGQIVVAVSAVTVGSDRGLVRPMVERIARAYGRTPKRCLVDGGFTKGEDIEWTFANGIKLYGPPTRSKHGTDPYAPRRKDGPGLAAWRRRMRSAHGKGVYKRRAQGEWINARFRRFGLHQLSVRGLEKATTVLRWCALANNILVGHRLIAVPA
jgi:transposase